MAPLPGWLFMLVGALVVGYTKFVESRDPNANLTAFFWIGLALLLYGVVKEAISRLSAKPRPKPEKVGPPPQREHDHDHRHPAGNEFSGVSPHATHQHVQQPRERGHPAEAAHKRCPRCHTLNSGRARYCNHCGHQFY